MDEPTRQLLLQRDATLLERLFTEINPYLARVCRANGIYDADSEEVIYGTWDRFFVNLEKFEGRAQIRTFICGILFNKIREHRRAAGRVSYEEDSEKIMGSPFTEDGWWKVEPPDPHRILELKRSGLLVKECLEGLTVQQKAAFLLREVEEESSAEICSALGVTIAHLRVLIFRAKDKLRLCLEGKASVEA